MNPCCLFVLQKLKICYNLNDVSCLREVCEENLYFFFPVRVAQSVSALHPGSECCQFQPHRTLGQSEGASLAIRFLVSISNNLSLVGIVDPLLMAQS